MPKINIDDLVQPIEVTVGGKTYIVEDIPRELATKMDEIGEAADAEKALRAAALKAGKSYKGKSTNTDDLVAIMTEVLGAEQADIAKLGMRKLLMLVTKVMGAINEELEAKNVPKAKVMK